jgi:phasin family protein
MTVAGALNQRACQKRSCSAIKKAPGRLDFEGFARIIPIVQRNKPGSPIPNSKEQTMYQTPEQLIALNKANLETALRLAGVALDGAERLIDLQLKTAKSVLADGLQNARALTAVRDFDQLAALKDTVVQPTFEKATAYAKEVYDVATAAQADVSKLVEEQVQEFNKQVISALDQIVKTAPAGSEVGIAAMKSTLAAVNTGFDNFTKVAKQFGEATQNNIEVVANQTIEAAKKAKKVA